MVLMLGIGLGGPGWDDGQHLHHPRRPHALARNGIYMEIFNIFIVARR
jgi:hypothetical protein